MSQALSSSVASSSSSKDDHGKIYPSSASDYDVLEEVGQGAFATVYRAIVKLTGEEVAIKVLNLDDFDLNWEEVRREILTMYNLAHSNVVKIYVSFVDGQDLWIVMPLCEAGSCATIMKTLAPNGFKNEVLLATIIKEALKGLEYLHKHDHIHRDIKAGNILVGKHGEIKLADFGVATTLLENGDRKKNRQTFTGTPCWMAPEVMEHSTGYGAKADIWSLGITAMELGYGRAPYSSLHPMKVMLAVLQEDPPTCAIYRDNSHQFSKYYHEFIAKCLRKDPTKRPTATKLLDHKFLRQAKDQQYIYEQMVSKLPPRPAAAPAQLRPHTCASKTLLDAEKEKKSKPVSVGSWVFDKEAFDQFKSKFQDEVKAEALAHKELAQTYCHPDGQESEDDDHPAIANANGNGVPKESPSAASRRNVFSDRSLFDEPTPSLHNGSVGASSPNGAAAEHQQGRFMVSEMEDSQVSGNHESGTDGDGGGLPVFHSGTLSISQSSYAPPIIGSQPNYASTPVHDQVGRFEVTEDEDA